VYVVATSRHTPVFLFENDYYFLFSDDLMRAIHRKSIIFVQTNYTMHVIHTENTYEKLIFQISETYLYEQQKVATAINSHLVLSYWKIGQHIVAFEQHGATKAQYGKGLMPQLSKDLAIAHGKGL
jgi:DUF1016 N-terminal domain